LTSSSFFFFFYLSLYSTAPFSHANSSRAFATKLSAKSLGSKHEKLTHLHFYFHNLLSGPNVTAEPLNKQGPIDFNDPARLFGRLTMVDNPLTLDPDLNSTTVGRAHGMYGVASKTEIDFMMVLNFVFSEGEYRGSTFSLLGHNAIFAGGEREMPVVGGTGVFRFGRGHAHAETYSLDTSTGNTVVEYNVYVVHY
ncbi:Dirigent protein 3, partial [Linum perenne]